MRWDNQELLNCSRRRSSRVDKSKLDGRNAFENDYTRVILCSSFRRLQDKTQVFPLEENDYVRTRLTHSIEVSSIASSIGASIEKILIEEKGDLTQDSKGQIRAILGTAGLLHDIGNPPFGHFGEIAIRNFFKDYFSNNKNKELIKELSDEQKMDFEYFDGNAHAFRIITKLQYTRDIYGLNLTYATLVSLLKYPRSSKEGNKKGDKRASYKKFGYFQSEKQTFLDIVQKTNIKSSFGKVYRHPLAFLLEAADDIAYSVADVEDGIKKGILTVEIICNILYKYLYYNDDGSKRNISDREKEIIKTLKMQIDDNYPDNDERLVQIFRAKVQSFMIESVVQCFSEVYDEIMEGKFDDEILMVSKAGRIRQAFKEISNILFNDKEIIKNELLGEKVITRLLELFVSAMTNKNSVGELLFKKNNTKEKRLYMLISDNYRYIFELYSKQNTYDRLMLVTDFICGMTDCYALDLYKKLNGVI